MDLKLLMRLGALLLCLLCTLQLSAQKLLIKNNLLHDFVLSPNLSAEFVVAEKWTVDTQVSANFFFYEKSVKSPKYKFEKISYWLFQPELRYWFDKSLRGLFVGLHAHVGDVNIGKYNLPFVLQNKNGAMANNRYEASFLGLGFSFGYQLPLAQRWFLDMSVGFAYAHIWYDKITCLNCRPLTGAQADYVGPSRLQLGIAYAIW